MADRHGPDVVGLFLGIHNREERIQEVKLWEKIAAAVWLLCMLITIAILMAGL